jgi:hypothetical protein
MPDVPIDALLDPESNGYKVCKHCNGFGSSMRDPEGVDTCTVCGGPGIIKKEIKCHR